MHRPHTANKPARKPFDKIDEMANIKSKLMIAGFTFYDIDRRFELPRGTAGTTLREPNAAGERAIAAALGTKPHLLWRRRYHASGLRKAPQPAENYERPLTMRQRQNEAQV